MANVRFVAERLTEGVAVVLPPLVLPPLPVPLEVPPELPPLVDVVPVPFVLPPPHPKTPSRITDPKATIRIRIVPLDLSHTRRGIGALPPHWVRRLPPQIEEADSVSIQEQPLSRPDR